MKRWILSLIVMGLITSVAAMAGDPPASGKEVKGAAAAQAPDAAVQPAQAHRQFAPADVKWGDAPPSLPKGAKAAVLDGDPAAPGLFTMRLLVPAGYRVPPHSHPAQEHVTVLSGELMMGLGETWDETKGHTMPAGTLGIMPAGVRHFAWTKAETVIQLHGIGPWGINYVNPQDDPRNQKQTAK